MYMLPNFNLQVHSCFHPFSGGFSKAPDLPPDILHTFYSTCWLSLAGLYNLRKMDTRLGVSLKGPIR